MLLKDLTINAIDAQIITDWKAIPNGRFVSFEYIKWDGRAAAGYNKNTKSGGAHTISVYSGLQKGVKFDAFKKVQDSLKTEGPLNNPARQNEVAVDDVDMLYYNTKNNKVKFMVCGGKINKDETRYYIPDGAGLYKKVTKDEYEAFLKGKGLSTTPKEYDNKRGIMVNQYNLKDITKFNGVVYRIVK